MRGTNRYANEAEYGEFTGASKYCLGIIKEFLHFHQHYIAACREMNVSYKLIDILASDWIARVQNCGCDAFLVWPSAITVTLKELYDERLKVMVDDLNKTIFPSYDELWMWESKRRMRDWLVAHGYPTPLTWIFYRYSEAMEFIRNAELPIVFKTNHGDSSRGVEIIRDRKIAEKLTKKVFSRGVAVDSALSGELQCGNIL
ncbi:MAG: hypothetical protein IMZ64_00750, partial [Bacteroidetes bacterium]|nr:hypothetical protein [Bacteroidota bacterium]